MPVTTPGNIGAYMGTRGRTLAGDPNPMPYVAGKYFTNKDGYYRGNNQDGNFCCCGCQFGSVGSTTAFPYCSDSIPAYYTVAFSGITVCSDCFDDTSAAGAGFVPPAKDGVANCNPNVTTGIGYDGFATQTWNNDDNGDDAHCVRPESIPGDIYALNGGGCETLPGTLSPPGSGTYTEFLIWLTNDATHWYLTLKSGFYGSLFTGQIARTDLSCYHDLTGPLVFTNTNTTCGADTVSQPIASGGGSLSTAVYATGGTATITPCCNNDGGMQVFPHGDYDPLWYEHHSDAVGI